MDDGEAAAAEQELAIQKVRDKVNSIYNEAPIDFETIQEYDHFVEEREEIIRLLLRTEPIEVRPSEDVTLTLAGNQWDVTGVAAGSQAAFLGIRADWFVLHRARKNVDGATWEEPTEELMRNPSQLSLSLKVQTESIWDFLSKYKKDNAAAVRRRALSRQRDRKNAITQVINSEGPFYVNVNNTSHQGETDGNLRHEFEKTYQAVLEKDDVLSATDSDEEVKVYRDAEATRTSRRNFNEATRLQMDAGGWPYGSWRQKAEDMLQRLWGV
eukprot:GEMP01050216.1.p1 GENE.GEMP01050216.1~~GEMP01050216.1.p1  ORF type:complete len:269 (+),score=67.08 GEMP01050216.1:43-849(+)